MHYISANQKQVFVAQSGEQTLVFLSSICSGQRCDNDNHRYPPLLENLHLGQTDVTWLFARLAAMLEIAIQGLIHCLRRALHRIA